MTSPEPGRAPNPIHGTRAVDDLSLLSAEIKRIHEEAYGGPPSAVRSQFVTDDDIVCVIDHDLLPYERTISNGGRSTAVRQLRAEFQETLRPTFIAAVERSVGRRVVAFMSDTHIDPPFSAEYFRFAAADG